MGDEKDAPLVLFQDTVLRYRHLTAFGMIEETVLDVTGEELAIHAGELVGIHAGGEGTFRFYHELAAWLQGLHLPFSGKLTIFGQETPLPPGLIARTARVFREGGVLPDFTVYENIELALAFSGLSRKEVVERAEEAMDRFDLTSYRGAYPGTDEVGLGAEKRLNYARAWARRPLLLCIDQPFLHIRDSYAVKAVNAVNELLAGGSAVVITTNQEHDLLPGSGGLTEWKPTRCLSLEWGRLSEFSPAARSAAADRRVPGEIGGSHA